MSTDAGGADHPSFKVRLALREMRRRLLAEIGDRGPGIEQRLGWPPGRLSEILQLQALVDLELEDFLQISAALGVEPSRFFQEEPELPGGSNEAS